MGAFFLSESGSGMSDGLLSVFRKKGFAEPYQFRAGDTALWYFKKQHISDPCFLTMGKVTVVTCGTCVYRGRAFPDNLQAMAGDYLCGNLDGSKFRGNFIVFFIDAQGIAYHADHVGQYNLYYEKDSGFCSSSFLAVATAVSNRAGRLALNRFAVLESLLTGNVIGPETLLESISRFVPSPCCGLPGMTPLLPRRTPDDPVCFPLDRHDLPDLQLQRLREHFSFYESLFRVYGTSSGLTGGLDSRLLYLVAREFAGEVRLYFNTTNPFSRESRAVTGFAGAAGVKVDVLKTRTSLEIDTGEYKELVRKGFHLWDGACRLHHLWLEERKSADHLRRMFGDCGAGLSGVGGEKFRNHDALLSGSYSIRRWLENEVVFHNCRDIFNSAADRDSFLGRFREKVMLLLGGDPNSSRVPLESIRRYYDVLYNTSNRTFRHSIENQLAFSLCPFVEPDLSVSGFKRIGRHMEFQMALIRKLAPQLQSLPFSYGFGPGQPPALKTRLAPRLKTDRLLPVFHLVRHHVTVKNSDYCLRMTGKHGFLMEYVDRVRDLGLPIRLRELESNPILGPIVVELGMFLSEMESCIATG